MYFDTRSGRLAGRETLHVVGPTRVASRDRPLQGCKSATGPTEASSPSTARPAETFQSVQALRGIAAIMVTIFHAGLRFDHTEATFRVGNAGVDIFFIISGFVMWTVVAKNPIDPITFLRRRFVRLVPLYWFWTLVLLAAWAVMPSAFPRLHPTIGHVLLSLGFIPHLSPDVGQVMPVMGQGWTLNFEIFFYLLVALILTLPARLRFVAIATALLLLPFARPVTDLPAAALLSPLLVEFLGGIVLARLVSGGLRLGALRSLGCLAAGAVLLTLAHPATGDDLGRLLQYGTPALLIVAGAVGLERAGRLPVGKLPRLLGDASYSIYLTHTFIISLLGKLWPTDLATSLFIVTATIVATTLGVFTYRLVERPPLTLLRGGNFQALRPMANLGRIFTLDRRAGCMLRGFGQHLHRGWPSGHETGCRP